MEIDRDVYKAVLTFLGGIYEREPEEVKQFWPEERVAREMAPIFEAYATTVVVSSIRSCTNTSKRERISKLHNFQRITGKSVSDWKKLSKEEQEKYAVKRINTSVSPTTGFAIMQSYLSHLKSLDEPHMPLMLQSALEWVADNKPDAVNASVMEQVKTHDWDYESPSWTHDILHAVWIPLLKNDSFGTWLKDLSRGLQDLRREMVGEVLERLLGKWLDEKFVPNNSYPPIEDAKKEFPDLVARTSALRSIKTGAKFKFENLSIENMRIWLKDRNVKGYSNKTRSELIELYEQYIAARTAFEGEVTERKTAGSARSALAAKSALATKSARPAGAAKGVKFLSDDLEGEEEEDIKSILKKPDISKLDPDASKKEIIDTFSHVPGLKMVYSKQRIIEIIREYYAL